MDGHIPADFPSSPNWALACPPGEERPACDLTTPIYDLTTEELAERALEAWLAEPRTTQTGGSPEEGWLRLEQRSAVFRFVDTIVAEFVSRGEEGASFLLYSRSNLGYWDLGVNKRRVERWIGLLNPDGGMGEAAD